MHQHGPPKPAPLCSAAFGSRVRQSLYDRFCDKGNIWKRYCVVDVCVARYDMNVPVILRTPVIVTVTTGRKRQAVIPRQILAKNEDIVTSERKGRSCAGC